MARPLKSSTFDRCQQRFLPRIAAGLLAVLAGIAPVAAADVPRPGSRVSDYAWMAGHWQGTMGEDVIEEGWFGPTGGAMVGIFRWIKNGELYLYEMFSLEQEEEQVVLVLRHFRRGLVALEDENGALRFELESFEEGKAVFTRKEEDQHLRLTYRQPQPDALEASLDITQGNETRTLVFPYTRFRR